jgi:CubicO group peptidase (beta-lactamase class C family)
VFDYDNAGYNLYTIGLQERFGINWKAALEEYILKPSGMNETTARLPVNVGLTEMSPRTHALPHTLDPSTDEAKLRITPLNKTDKSLHSAGGMISTAADLGNWLKLFINNGKINNKQIIDETIILESRKPIIEPTDKSFLFKKEASEKSYAFGWHHVNFAEQDIVYHNGSFPGFMTVTSFSPESKLGVAINVNEQFTSVFTAHILTRFAYRWWNNPEDASSYIASEVQEALGSKKQITKHFRKDFKERSKRNYKLDFSLNYSGVYTNNERGSIEVSQDGDILSFKHGNLYCVAEPFPYKNAVRLEFTPHNGIPSQFDIDKKDKQVLGLKHNGRYFKKQSEK